MTKGFALITGASSGIGREFARVFSSQGHPLVLVARRRERLDALASEVERDCGVRTLCLDLDLTASGAPGQISEWLQAEEIEIEYLVNNAGVGQAGRFLSHSLDSDLQTLELNIEAPVRLCKTFLPGMLSRARGGILNVASTGAFQAGPNIAIYYASKAFLLSFSEALSQEVRGSGVHVTALCPGPTQSEFHERAGMLSSRAVQGRRLPTSEEVARFGYESLMKNKTVVIHGTLNRSVVFLERLLPRRWVCMAIDWLQRGDRS